MEAQGNNHSTLTSPSPVSVTSSTWPWPGATEGGGMWEPVGEVMGDVTNTRPSFVEIQFRPKSNFNYRKLCKWVGININLATLDISRLASGSLIKDKSSI